MNTALHWEPVTSSHIDSFAPNPDNAEVYVRYKDGSIYLFPANTEEIEGMRTASSVGRYVRLMFGGKGRKVS